MLIYISLGRTPLDMRMRQGSGAGDATTTILVTGSTAYSFLGPKGRQLWGHPRRCSFPIFRGWRRRILAHREARLNCGKYVFFGPAVDDPAYDKRVIPSPPPRSPGQSGLEHAAGRGAEEILQNLPSHIRQGAETLVAAHLLGGRRRYGCPLAPCDEDKIGQRPSRFRRGDKVEGALSRGDG